MFYHYTHTHSHCDCGNPHKNPHQHNMSKLRVSKNVIKPTTAATAGYNGQPANRIQLNRTVQVNVLLFRFVHAHNYVQQHNTCYLQQQ